MEIDKIRRVVSGKASEEEREDVRVWMEGAEERKRFLKDAEEYYRGKVLGIGEESRRVARMWQRVSQSRKKRRMVVLRRWISVAACVTAVAGLILWWETLKEENVLKRVQPLEVAHAKGVKLILPDGSSHELSSSETIQADVPGFEVKATSSVQGQKQFVDTLSEPVVEYNEIIVPRGGEYTLTLVDGTTVILNSETRMRFPNTFVGTERKIFLSGEAYFDVARDENRPFLVEFQGGKVKVLGTRFNVQAYLGQNTFATLVSGKVEISSGRDSVVLHPGELCEISSVDRMLSVREADMMSVLAWKNGEFVFKDASLEQIVRALSRWYDTEIEYDALELQDMKFHIYMDRAKTLEEALQVISRMGEVTYEIVGGKVIIKKQ
ncbi:FecR domain-containing protein [Butyricimonas hominis]|uniref:FecR family protein n=1 Tax=Butyricimonas TaxID=574697 RepID=UPI0026DD7206|nr:FecR family protein [uncultured Butyricimonas sp.]